ncbi:hypothetical protein MTBBW1_1600002 [Desulfamplus magnetovallimortis]|uniref:Uncharacterized protein n=1 Tax=Desulfamplus magnetovallimortis TaxID=1246637 RepID=A0A1W1H8S0_9BACT|nr:hypothetical protein MTBBW1_1600002 [Desulfamplus magnetovallimortis]
MSNGLFDSFGFAIKMEVKEILFKGSYFFVIGGPVKLVVFTFKKRGSGITARGFYLFFQRCVKLVRNTMQSAYHWPERVNHALFFNVKRAHYFATLPLFCSGISFFENLSRPFLSFDSGRKRHRFKALNKISLFNECVVIKLRFTTVLFASIAFEAILCGFVLPLGIHIIIYLPEAIEKDIIVCI